MTSTEIHDGDGQHEHLPLEHVIGADLNGGLCTLNDQRSIVYSAAGRVIIQDASTLSQRLIETGSITAMSVSHSHNLIAIAEKDTGAVRIFDATNLRCRHKIAHESSNSTEIISISMSKDGTKCLTLGGAPNYALTMFDLSARNTTSYATLKLSTITKKALVDAAISPNDSTLVSVIGNRIIRLFHLSSKTRRFQAVKTNLKIEPTTQLWLNHDLVVASESGSLIVIGEEKELKQTLQVENIATTLAACPRGFGVGCNEGSVIIFQRKSKGDQYLMTRTVHLKASLSIHALTITNAEQESYDAVCLTGNRSIIRVPLTNDCNETELVPSFNQSAPSSIDSLIPDSGSLIVDSSVWRNLLVIGGHDGCIRLFNFQTHEVVLTHRFDDEKICNISMHPSGEYLLISTSSKVRLCAVLEDRLSTSWQVDDIKQSALVCFSLGGLFAVANGTAVEIHDLYASFKNVSTLRGHSDSILQMAFRGHKDELITVGTDGVVCLWDINRGVAVTRSLDTTSPAYLTAVISSDRSHVYATSVDGKLKKISVDKGEIIASTKYDPSAKLMTSLDEDRIIVSMSVGVECISLDDSGEIVRQKCFQLSSRVSSIHCTKDNLLIGSRDGFVTAYNFGGEQKEQSNYQPLDGLSLVSNADIEEQRDKEECLLRNIDDLKSRHKIAMETLQANHNENKEMVKDDLQMKLDRLRYEVNEMTDDIKSSQLDHKTRLESIQNEHEQNLASVREDCERKLDQEKANVQQLIQVFEDKKIEWATHQVELANIHTSIIDTETRNLHKLILDENQKKERLINDIETMRKQVSEHEKALREVAEQEMTDLSVNHRKQLDVLKEASSVLCNEKRVLQQRYATLMEDVKELEFQVDAQEDKLVGSKDTVSSLNEAIDADRMTISNQDLEISMKEREICSLSSKNLQQENANQLLVEQQLQIQEELNEKGVKVRQQSLAVEKKKAELKELKSTGKITRNELDGLILKLNQVRASLNKTQMIVDEKKKFITDLENGIMNAARQHNDDHKLLKSSICALSDQFLDGRSKRERNSSVTDKLSILDKKIDTMRATKERNRNIHEHEMKRLLKEQRLLEKELQDTLKQTKENSVLASSNRKQEHTQVQVPHYLTAS